MTGGVWLRSPRPLAAGAGRAGRGEALRPAGGCSRSRARPIAGKHCPQALPRTDGGGFRRITRRSDDHERHADDGGTVRAQRAAHLSGAHSSGARSGSAPSGVGALSRAGAWPPARHGAEPAAQRTAGPCGGGVGDGHGNPLHRHSRPRWRARRRSWQRGASRAADRAPQAAIGLGTAAAGGAWLLAEWAAYFAASVASAPRPRRDCRGRRPRGKRDDLLRDAATFLTVAERALGLEGEPMLPLSLRHAKMIR